MTITANRLRPSRDTVDLATVAGGNLTRNVLMGLVKILVAGFLAPQALGVLGAVYAFFRILTSVFGLGLGFTTVTLLSGAIRREDPHEQRRLLKSVFLLRLTVSAGLVAAGSAFAGQIARYLFADPSLAFYVRLAIVAVAGQLLWRHVTSVLSAHQRFGRLALATISMPLLMLIATLALIVTGRLSLDVVMYVYLLAPPVTALLWLPALDFSVLREKTVLRSEIGRVLRFSRWIYASMVAYSVRTEINPLLLKDPRLSGSLEVGQYRAGLYSFGADLANEISVVSQSLVTVLLPKAGRQASPEELRSFVRRSFRTVLLLIGPLALLMFLAEPAVRLLGLIRESYLEYLPSITVFQILYAGALLSLASIPMRTLFYTLELPKIETRLNLVMVWVMLAAGLILIPRFGHVGAAVAVVIQRVCFFAAISFLGAKKLRELRQQSGG